MDGIMLTEVSQTEKDKYCMISLNIWNLKIQQMREYKKRNRLTDTEK